MNYNAFVNEPGEPTARITLEEMRILLNSWQTKLESRITLTPLKVGLALLSMSLRDGPC